MFLTLAGCEYDSDGEPTVGIILESSITDGHLPPSFQDGYRVDRDGNRHLLYYFRGLRGPYYQRSADGW
jgi:hypothetical protein